MITPLTAGRYWLRSMFVPLLAGLPMARSMFTPLAAGRYKLRSMFTAPVALFTPHLGRVKQGFAYANGPFDPMMNPGIKMWT